VIFGAQTRIYDETGPTPGYLLFTFRVLDPILSAVTSLFTASYYYGFFGYDRRGLQSRAR
jgi:hypothetical protein